MDNRKVKLSAVVPSPTLVALPKAVATDGTMRGFILAAGLGTRLRPLTDVLPKPLVPVAGVPLIDRAVQQLVAANVFEIAVNLYHLGDPIRRWLGDGHQFGAQVTYFDEAPAILGTGGGVKNAEAFLRTGGPAFLLANGDVWHDFDLAAVRAAHEPTALATLVMHRSAHRPELHTVALRQTEPDRGTVVHIGGRPAQAPCDFKAIYAGIAVYSTALLDRLPPKGEACLVRQGLLPGMAAGQTVGWVEPKGHWFDCGTRAEVLRASAFALRARAAT